MGDATKSVLKVAGGGVAANLLTRSPLGVLPGALAGLAARDLQVTQERGEFAAKDEAQKKVEAEADAANRERIANYYADFEKQKGAQRLGRNSTMSRGILLNDNKGGLLR